MPQFLLIHVALNGNSRDMAGILNQTKIVGGRATRFTIMNGESPKDSAIAGEQRLGPHCTNPKRQEQVTVMLPYRVNGNISHIHCFPAVDCRAARSTFWTDCH